MAWQEGCEIKGYTLQSSPFVWNPMVQMNYYIYSIKETTVSVYVRLNNALGSINISGWICIGTMLFCQMYDE